MLPDIIEIAEEYLIEIDSRSYGKKETMAQCPFCNSGKFHLSLNQNKNIFKCWNCKKSGGVLQFESLVSEKPFDEIRAKYFGKKKAKKHPAYELSPEQLKQIGWHDKKRDSYHVFNKNKDEVVREWEKYCYEELVKYCSLFFIIEQYPFKEQQEQQFKWFLNECKKSKVDNIYQMILEAYRNNSTENWVIKSREIANISYTSCLNANDVNFINIFTNVLFTIEIMKVNKVKKTA